MFRRAMRVSRLIEQNQNKRDRTAHSVTAVAENGIFQPNGESYFALPLENRPKTRSETKLSRGWKRCRVPRLALWSRLNHRRPTWRILSMKINRCDMRIVRGISPLRDADELLLTSDSDSDACIILAYFRDMRSWAEPNSSSKFMRF